MKKVNVAVIGYGHLGKWHTQKAYQLENSNLVAIVEPYGPNQEKAKADEKKPAEDKKAPAKKEKLTTVAKEEPKTTEAPAATEAPKSDVDKKLDAIVNESAADL